MLLDQDLEVVERRTDVRIVLSTPGRFSLASRRGNDGERREFPCRIINISCHAVAVAAPIAVEKGERVLVHVDQFGRFEGPIFRKLDGGFVMEIIAPKSERHKLAAKIEWYEKNKNHDIEDLRRHARIVPRNPYSTLVLADGTRTECHVKDVSASGAAVHADVVPAIGTPIAIGKIIGLVVRHFGEGFAVQFAQEQDPKIVESLITRFR